MELIVISNPFAVADEAKLINELFRSGLKYFHLRKPESDLEEVKRLLREIAQEFHDRIALHQFHGMAADFGIKRLHYTESVRKISCFSTMQTQIADGFTLSTSIHDLTSLPRVDHFHYVFYGPVFDSISKTGYAGQVSEDFVLDRPLYKTKVMALGGVKGSNITRIKEMGFDGAAVLGTLWNEPLYAVERFNQLQELLPF
jgi:thiamine-phosphate pyrophosphorylase